LENRRGVDTLTVRTDSLRGQKHHFLEIWRRANTLTVWAGFLRKQKLDSQDFRGSVNTCRECVDSCPGTAL